MKRIYFREAITTIATIIAIMMFLFFLYDRYSTNLSVTLEYRFTIKKGMGDVYLNVRAVNFSHKVEYLRRPVFYFVESNDTISSFRTENYAFDDFPLKVEYGQEVNIECAIDGLLLEKIKSSYYENKKSEIKAIIEDTFGREFLSNTFTVENILLEYATFYDEELYNRIGGVSLLPQNLIK